MVLRGITILNYNLVFKRSQPQRLRMVLRLKQIWHNIGYDGSQPQSAENGSVRAEIFFLKFQLVKE